MDASTMLRFHSGFLYPMMRTMPLRPSRFVPLVLLLHAELGYAQSAPAPAEPVGLSLTQAVERFRTQNLKLVAARFDVAAERAAVIAAGLLSNPALSVDVQFHVHGEADSAERQYSIRLAQTLPLWGRLAATKDAARLTANAAERKFAASTWDLLGAVRRAYLNLQLAEEHHFVLAAGLGDLERVQHVLEARAAAGANPVYDKVRLEVERGNLRARVAEAELDVERARAELSSAIGGPAFEPPASDAILAASDLLAEPALDNRESDALVRHALEHRHEVAALHWEAGAAQARLRAARRRAIPEPELGIGYAHWSGLPGAPAGAAGGALLASASIALPVFDHGQGAIDRQLEQTRAMGAREQDTVSEVTREVRVAARTVQLANGAYLAYRAETSQSAESVRRVAELTYREGRGTILELLDAYSSYLRVEEQGLELRGAALFARLTLEQAIGP